MMIHGPWQVYKPGDAEHNAISAIFIKADEMDWYRYRRTITDRYLVVFNDDGCIVNVYEDHTRAFPCGSWTATVSEIPADYTRDTYRYGQDGFYRYTPTPEEIVAKNQRRVDRGCSLVEPELARLLAVSAVVPLTDTEQTRLETIKQFIRDVRAVDLNNPVWPDLP